MVAHARSETRHVIRTLVESTDAAVVEVADGEEAIARLDAGARFDLLLLELDLPLKDGLSVMQMHRLLLAHEQGSAVAPDVVFVLAPQVRDNAALTDHLRGLGAAGFIDDAPRAGVVELVAAILDARAMRQAGKPAAA